ncbi:MAG: hypothetical protein KDE03_07850 [Rhodobacteraceae bacterium]|nr:hypothetical protein [Paracoccaceae bacterium]
MSAILPIPETVLEMGPEMPCAGPFHTAFLPYFGVIFNPTGIVEKVCSNG